MGFSIPNLSELATRTARSFRANLKGSDAALWPNNVAVVAKVIAGAVWEPFSFLDYISRQIFVLTADGPFIDRHAAEYGMARKPATFAEGSIILSGDAGVTVPSGLVVQRADGLRYDVITSGTTNVDGNVTLGVRAQVAGKSGNAPAGVGMSLIAPLDRILSAGEVAPSGVGLGADQESDESLRQRVWFRKKLPPHGGAAHDYVAWAREIGGVTRVFVDPVTATNGRASVGVWFLMDELYANGIPQGADVTRVSAYINGLRPAGAVVDVSAPTPITVNIVIDGLTPDSTAIRNAVVAELTDLFRRVCRVSTTTDPFTLYRSKIIEAISIAAGEDHHLLTTPVADVVADTGQIPVLGTVTFT